MTWKSLLFPAICAAALTSAAAQTSFDASIGVWPWLVGNVDNNQDEIISKAKSTGLDTIYMHVWRTTGSRRGELRIFDEARTWNSADGSLIPRVTLSRFIDKAHAAGLQVVGVVQVFRDGGPYPNDLAHQSHIVEKVLRYLVHSYDARGNRVYPLDGIALDYIRWFGGNHDGSLVNRFLDSARKEIGAMPIHAYLIASAWYLDGPPYDRNHRSYAQAMSLLTRDYGQNWEDFAKRIDCLMPMAYTANGHVYGNSASLMEGYLNTVARYARQAVTRAGSRARVKPAIRTWNSSGQTTTRTTVEACARGALRGGADGFMAFRYFTARPHNDWFQGLARYSNPGPDLPIAKLSGAANGIDLRIDSSQSAHAKYASTSLRASFDLDDDGTFETANVPLGRRSWIVPGTGTRTIGMRVVDPRGATATTGVRVKVADFLTPTSSTISIANGGSANWRLNSGLAVAGSFYVVFATSSGTSPGTGFSGGVLLPVNIDYFTVLASSVLNLGPFQSFLGAIDRQGAAAPRFVIPRGLLGSGFVGTRLHFAALDIAPDTLNHRYASNAAEVRFVR